MWMSQSRRYLTRNVGASLIGKVSYALSQWAVLISLAKLGGADEVGIFALGLAITGPVFAFAGLDLEALQASDAGDKHRFSDYFLARVLSLPIAVLVSLGIGFLFEATSASVVAVVGAVACSKVVESFALAPHGLYNRMELMHLTARSLAVRGWLGAAGFVGMYALTESLIVAVIGMSAIWLVVLAVMDRACVGRLLGGGGERIVSVKSMLGQVWGEEARRGKIWGLVVLSFPAAVSRGVAALTMHVPRYAVEIYVGTAALGVFASLAFGIRVMEMIAGAKAAAATPRLARHWAEGRRRMFWRLLSTMSLGALSVALVAVIAAATVGERIVSFVYGREFAQGDLLITLVVAGGLLMLGKLWGAALLSMRLLQVRMALFIVSLLAGSVAAIVLVPARGTIGAAESLIVAFGSRTLGSACVLLYKSMNAWGVREQVGEVGEGDMG